MDYFNKTFWALFVVIGLFIIVSSVVNIFFVDVLLGLAVIVIGVHKLAEESKSREIEINQGKMAGKINQILDWLDHNHKYTKNLGAKTDFRLDKFHKSKQDSEERHEKLYDDLAKKIIHIENRMTDLSKAFVAREQIRSGRGLRE